MTSINVFIGGVDYGDCVVQADLWRDSANLIGQWEIVFDITGDCTWPIPHTFAVDTDVQIVIDGATMMWGYIDDILPQLDTRGHHTILVKMTGRDRGMDLAQHYVTAEYFNINAATILGNAAGSLLRLIPSEIDRVTVGAAPGNISYEADRTYLSDAVREVLDLIGYDGYIDNTAVGAGNVTLNIFAPGASAAGITLIDFPNSILNNILHIEPVGEAIGFDVKNYIEGTCGSLSDHYTDENAADWTAANCALTNEVGIFLNGKSAIRATNNTGGIAAMYATLDFALPATQGIYHYTSLDLSEPARGSFNYYTHDTRNAIKSVRIGLTDNGGNSIEYYRSVNLALAFGQGPPNVTEAYSNDQWRKVDIELGSTSIEAGGLIAGDTNGHWYQIAGAGFNWFNVTEIYVFNVATNPVNIGDFWILDGLSFPNLEVHSIQQNAPSIGLYGQRMKDFYQPSIKNQYDLNAYTTRKLVELKDPKENIHCITIGQTGTPYPSQTLDVVAPDFGIGGPFITDTIEYRIIQLHHKVVKNSAESEQPGWNFLTEYDLVRHQYYGTATVQYVEPSRIIKTVSPTESILRETRLAEQYRRRGANVRLSP